MYGKVCFSLSLPKTVTEKAYLSPMLPRMVDGEACLLPVLAKTATVLLFLFPIKNGHHVERFLWPTPFAAHLHGDGEHEVDEGVQLPTGAEVEARELGVVAFGKRQPDGLSAVVGSHLSVMTG